MTHTDDNLKDLHELRKLILRESNNTDCKDNAPSTGKKLSNCDTDCEEEISGEKTLITKDASMWATSGNSYFATERAVDRLESGQYVVSYSPAAGFYFTKKTINLDNLLVLPDSNSEQVLGTIQYFWDNEDKFRKHGFLWKRGIMLWGPPGSGKTSTVQQLSKQIVDLGGVTIYCDHPGNTAAGLSLFRTIEPNRQVVVILEDIDAIISNHGEAELLAMLDGEHQTDNVVFIATTNYPQYLDDRFINRPSRFDEIIKIGMPKAAARQYYLAAINPRLLDNEEELTEWVNLTDGFSIAHLKELIISVECFGKSLEKAHEMLRIMIDTTASQYSNSMASGDSTFGFASKK